MIYDNLQEYQAYNNLALNIEMFEESTHKAVNNN